MDTLIENGSFKTDENGLPIKITGYDELVQRAVFCLTVPRGSFLHNKNFGSRLHAIKDSAYDAKNRQALLWAQEALSEQPNISAYSAELITNEEREITGVRIGLLILDNREEVTVNL